MSRAPKAKRETTSYEDEYEDTDTEDTDTEDTDTENTEDPVIIGTSLRDMCLNAPIIRGTPIVYRTSSTIDAQAHYRCTLPNSSYTPAPSSATKLSTSSHAKSTASAPLFSASTVSSRKKSKLQPGHAYIFNNEEFDNPSYDYRVGSSQDVESLRRTFKYFKMNVNVITNATLNQIDSTVHAIATADYTNISCLLIVILSHGNRHDEVCARDGIYSIDDKVLFPILQSRTLKGKPKIMLIQACKGAMIVGQLHIDAVRPHGPPAEILKCYSTFEGYVSYRGHLGSIFIQTACEFLQKFGSTKHVKEIMEKVIKQVKEKTQGGQIPSILSTLTEDYFLSDYV